MSFRCVRKQTGPAFGFSSETTDEDLVVVYQADPGSPEGKQAVSLLLERYRKQVLMWCGRYLREREGALDMAQDVLLSAFNNLAGYRNQDKFSAWLFIITRNHCLSELRRKQLPLAGDGVLDFLVDPGKGPDAILEEKIHGSEFLKLVAETLTTEEQDALWMRCFEGLPVEAITHQLGITGTSGARAVLQKARRKLKRTLADRDRLYRESES